MHNPGLLTEFSDAGASIASAYQDREYSRAMREIMALADRANQYIDDHKPWVLAKESGSEDQLQEICSMGLNCFRYLVVYLKPVLPVLAEQAEEFLNIKPLVWDDIHTPLLEHSINQFMPLMTRVEKEKIDAMIEESKEDLEVTGKPSQDKSGNPETEPLADEISLTDFAKIDLRVARITRAEYVEGADKLLRLTLDIGGQTRTMLAGIKSAYRPEDLEGRLTVVVANLAPRKTRFGLSEGMVLAAGPGGENLYLLSPDDGAEPGMRIK